MTADPKPPDRLGFGRFAMIGSQMAVFTLVGVGVDSAFGVLPWATIGLTLVGFLAVVVQLARVVLKNGPGPADSGGRESR